MKTIDISLKVRLRVSVEEGESEDDVLRAAIALVQGRIKNNPAGKLRLQELLSVGPVIGGGQ